MSNEPEILPPQTHSEGRLRSVEDRVPVTIFSPWIERFRRKTVEERNRYLQALREYVEEKTRINHAVVDHEKSVVALRQINEIRKTESLRIRTELERTELEAIQGLHVAKQRMLLESLELEAKVIDAQEKLDRKKNPPTKETGPDLKSESIRNIYRGGGRYTQEAKAERDRIIRERGGEHNLTPEDKEMIETALRTAADFDQGRSNR